MRDDTTITTTSAAHPAKKHAVEPNGLPAFVGGTPGDVLPTKSYCGRTMNPQTYALLLEIAQLENVTPQEVMERIVESVLEQAKDNEDTIDTIRDLIINPSSALS